MSVPAKRDVPCLFLRVPSEAARSMGFSVDHFGKHKVKDLLAKAGKLRYIGSEPVVRPVDLEDYVMKNFPCDKEDRCA